MPQHIRAAITSDPMSASIAYHMCEYYFSQDSVYDDGYVCKLRGMEFAEDRKAAIGTTESKSCQVFSDDNGGSPE